MVDSREEEERKLCLWSGSVDGSRRQIFCFLLSVEGMYGITWYRECLEIVLGGRRRGSTVVGLGRL